MRYLILTLFLPAFLFATSLSAQSRFSPNRTGWFLDGSLGITANGDEQVRNRPALRLGIDHKIKLGYRLAIVGGLGLQGRHTKAVTRDNFYWPDDLDVVIVGQIVLRWMENEYLRTDELEAFAKVGLRYHSGRLILGLDALPAYRLSNDLVYFNRRRFETETRPDDLMKFTFASGDDVGLADGTFQPIRYTNRMNLQAALSLNYQLTGRLQVGILFQPMLTNYDVEFGERFTCGLPDCEQLVNPEHIFSAQVNATSLSFSFSL